MHSQASLAIDTCKRLTAASLTKYPAMQTPYRQAPQCSYEQPSFASYRHTHLTAASLTKHPAIQTPYRQAPQRSYAQSCFASYRHTRRTAASLTISTQLYKLLTGKRLNVAMHSQASLAIDTQARITAASFTKYRDRLKRYRQASPPRGHLQCL